MTRPLTFHALRRTGAGLLLLLVLGALPVAGDGGGSALLATPAPTGQAGIDPAHSVPSANAPAPAQSPDASRPAAAEAAPGARAAFSRRPLAVPFRRIDRAHRNAVRSMMEGATLIRRLPARRFHSDMRTYVYLLDNLPLSSKLSELLGYGSYTIVRTEDGRFHGRDFSGVEGDFWLAYADTGVRIYLGEGSYDSWYTPKISAKVLLVADFAEIRPGEMATRVDIYVSTNRLVGYLMELMGHVTDRKLSQLLSSAQHTSQMVSNYPRRVWGEMTASDLFTPEELRGFKQVLLVPPGKAGSTHPRDAATQ